MARHKHRPHGYGPARGGGHHHPSTSSQSIRCKHCDVVQSAGRFPKSALSKYHKRLARGDDPASINIICWTCCQNPTAPAASALNSNSAAAAGPSQPRPRALDVPAPPSQLDSRVSCSKCGIDYPRSIEYFALADLKLSATGRCCFSCRVKQGVSAAIDDMVPDGYALEEEEDDEDDQIHVDVSSEDEDNEQQLLPRRIEDLDEVKRAEARRARTDFNNLSTMKGFSRTLVERRRVRFVPCRILLRQQRQQRIQRDKASLNPRNAEERYARLFSLRAVYRIEGSELLHISSKDKTALDEIDDGDPADYTPNRALSSAQHVDVDQQYRDSTEDGDNDSDDPDVDVVPSWYLSNRQRIEMIQRRHQLERDLEINDNAAPKQEFSQQDLDPIIDDDMVRHFEQRFSVARESAPSSAQESKLASFRMTRLLRALDEQSRQHPAKRFRDSKA
ncbi:uncharacterized protein SRS1_13142 [Sporisorium reilianum f. sp. reilianum]|uniref:Uncharacterized protein n=1 Tax=Sporisorium reilianum f. sp. reilianum TaxID=72559 RepID=A0A2N8UB97_9BASI|nr:uncharacterized protein SRS1_13142 [Sporisorium reilianum f. sp. reilianum]